jgi:hypothetical protein
MSAAERVVTVASACPDYLTSETVELLRKVLDKGELSRLVRLKDDDARRQSLVAHVLLRTVFSAHCHVLPSEW